MSLYEYFFQNSKNHNLKISSFFIWKIYMVAKYVFSVKMITKYVFSF